MSAAGLFLIDFFNGVWRHRERAQSMANSTHLAQPRATGPVSGVDRHRPWLPSGKMCISKGMPCFCRADAISRLLHTDTFSSAAVCHRKKRWCVSGNLHLQRQKLTLKQGRVTQKDLKGTGVGKFAGGNNGIAGNHAVEDVSTAVFLTFSSVYQPAESADTSGTLLLVAGWESPIDDCPVAVQIALKDYPCPGASGT